LKEVESLKKKEESPGLESRLREKWKQERSWQHGPPLQGLEQWMQEELLTLDAVFEGVRTAEAEAEATPMIM
jgi:hypothetical protein